MSGVEKLLIPLELVVSPKSVVKVEGLQYSRELSIN
jgi:hypothetical protein